MSVTSIHKRTEKQRGLALIDVMLAILLVAVGMTGCLYYQHEIGKIQLRQQQELALWRSASQLLDASAGGMTLDEAARLLSLPTQWRWQRFNQPVTEGCERFSVKITAPLNLSAQLERIICSRT